MVFLTDEQVVAYYRRKWFDPYMTLAAARAMEAGDKKAGRLRDPEEVARIIGS